MKSKSDSFGIKKQSHTTMFEVSDKGREHEYAYRRSYNGGDYPKMFVEFLESLGYEVESETHTDNIKIRGVRFGIDASNASYKAKNTYTREVTVRKPQNRYISISTGYKAPAIRIHINKEIDADKLKKRIEAAITERLNMEQAVLDREADRIAKTTAIAKHYLGTKTVRDALTHLYINRGTISFNFKDSNFHFYLNADGTIGGISFSQEKIDPLAAFVDGISTRAKQFQIVVKILVRVPALTAEQQEFVNTEHHQYFYLDTMSTSK